MGIKTLQKHTQRVSSFIGEYAKSCNLSDHHIFIIVGTIAGEVLRAMPQNAQENYLKVLKARFDMIINEGKEKDL